MKSGFRELSKSQNDWVIGGILCGIFLLLGIAIAWLGWWVVPIVLLIMLFIWDWRWALAITLAAGWAFFLG
ncbi:MAG: hypothetical protein OSJ36_05020 [Odoribacter sp.]|nr:hypothetical protein [Odoribacter sp.]